MSDEIKREVPPFVVEDLLPEEAVSKLIDHAAAILASDLFFISNEDHVAVLVRHLGLIREVTTMPIEMGRRCMTHVKAVAGLDVAERRRPQDGRWVKEREGDDPLDLRISTIPTLYGEDFTFRILDASNRFLSLDQLGLMQRDHNQLLNLLNSPGGLLLVTGPTGSGKTTTLYACLAYLNNGQRKINTIEDPVEYVIPGIRQSNVNPRIDVGFPQLLRGVLRQAPDVIMIGELRDPETAETAVRAANSGHLVLATMHAPIAAGAIQSLLGLGVNAHFMADALLGVVAQRLARTLCTECRQPIDLSVGDLPQSFEEVKSWLEPGQGQRLYSAQSCAACYRTGYAGRTGVFELLAMNRDLRSLVGQRQPIHVIHQKAMEHGLISFRQSALLKVARGETTVEEVFRVVPSEYLGLEG
jgi:type II secretory ATPase GspE/PulE/Tfp pilus assembly ATPase PilB-like protein